MLKDSYPLFHSCIYLHLVLIWEFGLSYSGLFIVKSFFSILSNHIDLIPLFLIDFVWKSQASFKVKSFVWLVALKKVNTNDMLQLRKSYKVLSPDVCLLCMESDEMVDHIFLYCPLSLGLWYRLFNLAHMDWVLLRSICNMMIVSYKGLGSTNRARCCGSSLVLLWCGLCGRKEMLGFLGQGENFRGSLGHNSFFSLLLGFLHHNF